MFISNIYSLETALNHNSGNNIKLGSLIVSRNNIDFLSSLNIVDSGNRSTSFIGILTYEGVIKPYSIFQEDKLSGYEDIRDGNEYPSFVKHAVNDKAQALYYSKGGYSENIILKSLIIAGEYNIKTIFIPTSTGYYLDTTKNIVVCEVESSKILKLKSFKENVFSEEGELIESSSVRFNPSSLNTKITNLYKKLKFDEIRLLKNKYLPLYTKNHCPR